MVYHLITDRQADYVELACAGHSIEEIAAAMGVAKSTVIGHRHMVLVRLRVKTIDEVCAMVDSTTKRPAPVHTWHGRPHRIDRRRS